jgi:glycosyltransferase involved in cell wall biosynthesis
MVPLNLRLVEGRKRSYEVVIVDDGSKDATSEVAQGRITSWAHRKSYQIEVGKKDKKLRVEVSVRFIQWEREIL